MHADAVTRGQRVLSIDDLIATGGTAEAAARLIEQAGGKLVGCGFLIDLTFLKGTEKLKKYAVFSLFSTIPSELRRTLTAEVEYTVEWIWHSC